MKIFAAYSVENHNEVQAVLNDMKLMQRALLSSYCSATLKLMPVEVVMHSVVLHLSLVIDDHFTMHI